MTTDEKRELATNRNTPPEALSQLAGDKDEDVRFALAKHPNTPQDALRRLAEYEYLQYIRVAVAEHPTISKETLAWLVENDYYDACGIAIDRLAEMYKEAGLDGAQLAKELKCTLGMGAKQMVWILASPAGLGLDYDQVVSALHNGLGLSPAEIASSMTSSPRVAKALHSLGLTRKEIFAAFREGNVAPYKNDKALKETIAYAIRGKMRGDLDSLITL
jgi:hypothetical protein